MNCSRTALSAVAAAVLVALAVPRAARAESIISLSASGPGGTAVTSVDNPSVARVRLDYTSLNYIDITMTVDRGGNYSIDEASGTYPLFVRNSTGVDWAQFRIDLISAPSGSSLVGATNVTFIFQSPAVRTGNNSLTFTGGILPSGNAFFPFINLSVGAAGTVVVRQTPVAIPEPSSLVLLSLAMMGVVGLYRRGRRSR